ncbi:MAG: DUF423 domain-containing protein [Bacteroidota bacterium]|jgi:uncharacterized membrane protein YgdD (TMEM256/DUF423 family)
MTNHTLQKQLFQIGTSIAGLAVTLGAFGAHALKNSVSESDIAIFETGVKYQFYHALALFMLAVFLRRMDEKTVKQVRLLFSLGIALFCISLYLLATRSLWIGDELKWIGVITPVGGTAFILGWFLLAFRGYKHSSGDESKSSRGRSHKHTIK